MESYNAVNGEFMTRNKRLLQEILKDKIGFAGFIMSDWWAINTETYENFAFGCDMNMPGGPGWTPNPTGKDGSWWAKIPEWIQDSTNDMTEDRVDDAARRIIAAMYRVNLLSDRTLTDADLYPKYVDLNRISVVANAEGVLSENKGLNREVGRESIVLLENKDNFLPLANNKNTNPTFSSLKIFGNSAEESVCLNKTENSSDCTCIGDKSDPDNNRYFKGYVGLGWGSGTTHFEYQVAPLDAIKAKAESLGKTVTSSTGLTGEWNNLKEVIPTAATDCANINVVFIAANSGEEYLKTEGLKGDRTTLDAWHGGNDLVDAVLNLCDNVVLVILGPATVNIKSDWRSNSKLKAILFGGMLGAEGGNAITDVLFGDVVPSGHLTFVWAPVDSYPSVTPATKKDGEDAKITVDYNYDEGLFVGQRYVEKYSKPFDYPFGYGLSYTTFEISDPTLTMKENGLTVKFNVKNTGKYDGKVVPMVFLGIPVPDPDNYPAKVLKGFDKKLIKSGESASFEIFIDDHDLSYYDTTEKDFVRPTTGTYTVYVGENAKSENLKSKTISASY
jgi:beta-glucosidase